ncbi:hypothetical protein AA958_03145 [Streptomyces sp. CNQ-509]|nr:hypothetical protein AA958_03145 [Streptomyces sp. CNQ-509]
MAARNTARKRAFQIIFESDQRGAPAGQVLEDWIRLGRTDPRQPPVGDFTRRLVEGYAEHAARIDELLSSYSVGWTLDRMPVVDRSILRLGAYELIWEDETPDAVAIDEAVQLTKEFSTDDSPGFVNGLLGRLQELKPRLRRDTDEGPAAAAEAVPEPGADAVGASAPRDAGADPGRDTAADGSRSAARDESGDAAATGDSGGAAAEQVPGAPPAEDVPDGARSDAG